MAIRNEVFRAYLARYRDAVRTARYGDLATLQPPPFASLNEGGAGTAYALWRLGELPRARRWIAGAAADRRRDAYDRTLTADQRRGSFLFGAVGLRWVEAMVARSPARLASYARAIARPTELDEYASGAAGHLLGATVLLARVPHLPLERAAGAIAQRLTARLHDRQRAPWRSSDATGFAHGWPGICYAVLAWSARRRERPAWLLDAVARLAEAWDPDAAPAHFVGSWCNGAAGALLLWARAYADSGDRRFLSVARRAARTAIEASGQRASLCCGDAGVGFALLALDRVDRRAGGRRAARVLAARAIAGASFVHPSGLFQGHPGLACLAADLLDAPRGFPGVEG